MAPKAKTKSGDVVVSTSTEAAQAISHYLSALGQPKQAGRKEKPKLDVEAVTKGISDPLKKLAAIKAAREALVPKPDSEELFIKFAPAYAKTNGLVREDFALLGVSARVLNAVFGGGTVRKVAGERRYRMTKADKDAQTARIVAHIDGLKSGTEFKTAEISEVLNVKGTDALETINAILKAGGTIVKEGEKKNTKYVRL